MSVVTADRNLLFGMLALQMDFIGRDALIQAMQAWVFDKNKPLGEILVAQNVLRPERRTLLDALVEEHLRQHGNDTQQSLAALSSVGSAKEDLKQIADADVQASLVQVSAARGSDDFATRAPSVGESTSAGVRFRILRPHARGGLGEVFVAEDSELHREVALKEIQDRHADKPDSRARFVLEAEITGGLEHPGIVPVYGLGQYADGRPFYAMRFIRGDSLKEAIERYHQADGAKRDPGERAVEFRKLLGRFIDVCNAIAYAHSRGVLHRDLKPGNIMLGKYGETLVVDWGLAKPLGKKEEQNSDEAPLQPSTQSGTAETVAGSAIGTPQFMSPEQAAGRLDQLGPVSDVYSLGATLYALLTGKPPFADADVGSILQKVQRGDFPQPQLVKPAVPTALQAICLKAMQLKPEARYASPRALADDIEHWLADEPVSAWREPWTARAARWTRRHRTAVTSVSVAALLVIAGLVTILFVEHRRRQQAHEYLANLQTSAQAEGQLASAEMRVGRFASAQAILQQACDRLVGEPQLEAVRMDLEARRQRLQRLVDFYNLADEAERLSFDERTPETLAAGQAALKTLGALDQPDWWAHLPDAGLTPAQRAHLQNEAYRLMHLVAGLYVVKSFGSPAPAADLRSALDMSERAERFQPSHIGQWLQRGCRLELEEPDKARPPPAGAPSAIDNYYLGFLNWAIARNPDNPFAQLIVRGQGNLPEGLDFQAPLTKAEEYFRKALRIEPESYFVYLVLSNTLMQSKRYQEAELAANGAIGLRPNYEVGHTFRAATNLQQGIDEKDVRLKKQSIDRAISDCNRALQINPKYAEAYHVRGVAHTQQGANDKAMADYGEAIRLDPTNVMYLLHRGNAYQLNNDFDHALADFNAAIQLDSRDARPYTYRGQLHAARKEWDRASADYTEALRIQPRNAPALIYRGLVHYRRKEYDQAIADSTQALQINPQDTRGYVNRGASYYFKKDYKHALADLDEAIRLNPSLPNPYNYRGRVYAALREPEKAVADLKEALRLNPRYADAYSSLAWLWATYPDAKVRDGKKAVEYATRACEMASWKDPVSLHTLAAAHAEVGDFDQAVRRQQQALDLDGWTADERQEERQRLQLYQEHKAFHEK